MDGLLWFHAFNRNSLGDIVAVLRDGPTPPTVPLNSKTEANERELGLERSVYAYLGRSSDTFGKNGFAFGLLAPHDGSVSPFDTGGLVERIAPISEWPTDERQEFLRRYSWEVSTLEQQLKRYPRSGGIESYLRGEAPPVPGPHKLWKGPAAPIWEPASANEWPAWTWELRSLLPLPVGDALVNWTCPSDTFEDIMGAGVDDDEDIGLLEELAAKYVAGGISQLIVHVRNAGGAQ